MNIMINLRKKVGYTYVCNSKESAEKLSRALSANGFLYSIRFAKHDSVIFDIETDLRKLNKVSDLIKEVEA